MIWIYGRLWNKPSHHELLQWEEFLSPSQEQHSEVTPALTTQISDPSLWALLGDVSRSPGRDILHHAYSSRENETEKTIQ
jgi:hypothetical protein